MAATTSTKPPGFLATLRERAKPYLIPYYFAVVAILGGITTVFVVLTVLIILIATNFNVLGLIE
jgi:hypothetical protein